MQSVALAQRNFNFAKKKKKNMFDFLHQGTENIVGASFIDETADFI